MLASLVVLTFSYGLSLVLADIDVKPKIVNGVPTTNSEWPWIVSLSFYSDRPTLDFTFHSCGGSLIQLKPPVVLTAAHCLDSVESDLKFLKGQLDTNDVEYVAYIGRTIVVRDTGEMHQRNPVEDWYIHQGYNSSFVNDDDIALLVLEEEISSVDAPNAAAIHYDEPGNDFEHGDFLRAIGYGDDFANGPNTLTLEYVDMEYWNTSYCDRVFKLYVFNEVFGWPGGSPVGYDWNNPNFTRMDANPNFTEVTLIGDGKICARGNNSGVCQGDSGGPLIDDMDAMNATQVGLASFVIGECNAGLPDVFTHVQYYADNGWISGALACINCDDKGLEMDCRACDEWEDEFGEAVTREQNNAFIANNVVVSILIALICLSAML